MSTLPIENEMLRCDSIEDVIQNFGDLHELATEMDSFRELAISVESRRSELLSEYPDQWICGLQGWGRCDSRLQGRTV